GAVAGCAEKGDGNECKEGGCYPGSAHRGGQRPDGARRHPQLADVTAYHFLCPDTPAGRGQCGGICPLRTGRPRVYASFYVPGYTPSDTISHLFVVGINGFTVQAGMVTNRLNRGHVWFALRM